MAAQLIDIGIDAPVLKIKLDGFDTMRTNLAPSNLLRDLGRGLAGLRQSLIRSGHWDSTLIMTYSNLVDAHLKMNQKAPIMEQLHRILCCQGL